MNIESENDLDAIKLSTPPISSNQKNPVVHTPSSSNNQMSSEQISDFIIEYDEKNTEMQMPHQTISPFQNIMNSKPKIKNQVRKCNLQRNYFYQKKSSDEIDIEWDSGNEYHSLVENQQLNNGEDQQQFNAFQTPPKKKDQQQQQQQCYLQKQNYCQPLQKKIINQQQLELQCNYQKSENNQLKKQSYIKNPQPTRINKENQQQLQNKMKSLENRWVNSKINLENSIQKLLNNFKNLQLIQNDIVNEVKYSQQCILNQEQNDDIQNKNNMYQKENLSQNTFDKYNLLSRISKKGSICTKQINKLEEKFQKSLNQDQQTKKLFEQYFIDLPLSQPQKTLNQQNSLNIQNPSFSPGEGTDQSGSSSSGGDKRSNQYVVPKKKIRKVKNFNNLNKEKESNITKQRFPFFNKIMLNNNPEEQEDNYIDNVNDKGSQKLCGKRKFFQKLRNIKLNNMFNVLPEFTNLQYITRTFSRA